MPRPPSRLPLAQQRSARSRAPASQPRSRGARSAPWHRPLLFAASFASLLLLGAIASAQYLPTQPGHPLGQVYIPWVPGGTTPPGGRISVDANINNIIDNADLATLATTATYALTAGALGSPPGQGGAPTPSAQLLVRGCQLLVPLTTGTGAPIAVPLQNPFPAATCIDGVCHLILREVPTSPGVVDTSLVTYYQNGADNYWIATSQNPAGAIPFPARNSDGLNGDATFTQLALHNNVFLTDDSATEALPTQLSLQDSSTTHDAELWICSS